MTLTLTKKLGLFLLVNAAAGLAALAGVFYYFEHAQIAPTFPNEPVLLLALASVDLVLLLSGLALTRRHLVRPLRTVEEGARRLEAGDFSPVLLETRDEIADVATSVNDLAAAMGRLSGEREKSLEALRTTEKRYRLLFERNLAGVFLSTPEGRIVECNAALARAFGHDTPERLVESGQCFFDPSHQAPGSRLRAEGSLTGLEVRARRRDGKALWLLASAHFVEGTSDLVEGMIVDITERKEAEDTVRALLRISEKLNASLDVDTLMDDLVREALELVGAESGCSGLRSPEGMVCRKYFQQSRIIPLDYCWAPGQGLAGWLMNHGVPYIANDAPADSQTDGEFCARLGVRSAICSPIPDTQGEVIGFLEIHNKKEQTGFTSADPERLMAVCQTVSTAIQNALAYRKVLRADEALRASEQRYRELVENANDVIYTRDLAGNFTSFNKAAERITGFSREEALRMNIGQILAPEHEKTSPQSGEGRPPDGGPATHELVILAKDGHRLTLEVSTRLIYEDAMPVGIQGIARDVTERRRAERAVRQLSGRLLRLQDEERRRIARELHDSTAQSLAALTMSLTQVQESAAALDPAGRRALETGLELADQSSKEVRTLSYLLHPPLLDELGLPSALKWYAQGFAQRSGIAVDLDVSPGLGRMHQDLEMTLFRIVQECLTNIHRHSGSPRASIRISADSTEILLEVKDEGQGMPPEALQSARTESAGVGVGIVGMRERVSQLGGRLEIYSGGSGTMVTAVLPRLQAA